MIKNDNTFIQLFQCIFSLGSTICWLILKNLLLYLYLYHNPNMTNTTQSLTLKLKLTVNESRRVVVDVGEHDGDGGGARQAAHLANHVFGLDDKNILVPGLTVHVGQSCPDDT